MLVLDSTDSSSHQHVGAKAEVLNATLSIFFAEVQIFELWTRWDTRNAQLPDRHFATNAQNVLQDLWLHLYIDLTSKLDATPREFSVNAALRTLFF